MDQNFLFFLVSVYNSATVDVRFAVIVLVLVLMLLMMVMMTKRRRCDTVMDFLMIFYVLSLFQADMLSMKNSW